MPQKTHPGFMAAAMTNIVGILAFSRFFSNGLLGQLFPGLFGNWGLGCIILWGLAYAAVANNYRTVPLLVAVFALEKFLYVGSWLWWMAHNASFLPNIWQQDPSTATFFALYGLIDLGFGLFFWQVYTTSGQPALLE